MASHNGHVEVVDKLLQHGARVDLQTQVIITVNPLLGDKPNSRHLLYSRQSAMYVPSVCPFYVIQSDPTYPDVIVAGTPVYRAHSPRSAINTQSNAHAHYRLIFELSESAGSRVMVSVTCKRRIVTLERKLDVIRMLEDGKS